ncbi:MAG: TIM barrel protein [Lentisphaeria bacterium]
MKSVDFSCISARSMPFWCVGAPLSDPFGGAVLDRMDSAKVAELIAWAGREGLIEATSYHDDDLVSWDPEKPEDDLDPDSETSKKLRVIKEILDGAGVRVHASICSLHGHRMFRNGGLCNPDPAIRALAAKKVERTLRIGRFFGAKYYVYWVARDGFEVPVVTDWANVYRWLADGLNHVTEYIREQKMDNYVGATVEPKPNEPRGQMFLPTSGHATGFIFGMLKEKDFWGVNPELLQHESMALMNASMTISFLCSMNKLKFLHFGSQIKAQFDNDFPPLTGPEGLKETAYLFHTLKKMEWRGVCEFDCHMLRAEGDIDDQIKCRKQFIVNCVTGLAMALELANRIPDLSPLQYSQTEADLIATRKMCALGEVAIQRTERI